MIELIKEFGMAILLWERWNASSNIKRQARDLYECLVWLQYNAEESGR